MTDEYSEEYPIHREPVARAQELVTQRKAAYHRTFEGTGVDGKAVMADLANFCRAHQSTFHPNPTVANRLDGRREVWLRIQQHLQLTDQQLWDLFRIPRI